MPVQRRRATIGWFTTLWRVDARKSAWRVVTSHRVPRGRCTTVTYHPWSASLNHFVITRLARLTERNIGRMSRYTMRQSVERIVKYGKEIFNSVMRDINVYLQTGKMLGDISFLLLNYRSSKNWKWECWWYIHVYLCKLTRIFVWNTYH